MQIRPEDVPGRFMRGDSNLDREHNVSDVVTTLGYLFRGEHLQCLDAADVNDDGNIDILDPIQSLITQFVTPDARLEPPNMITKDGNPANGNLDNLVMDGAGARGGGIDTSSDNNRVCDGYFND